MTTPTHHQSIVEISRRLHDGDFSAEALSQTLFDRIAQLDPTLNAYATLMINSALAAARQADKEIRAGQLRGALHGVPIAVKDLCYTRGVATMGGLKVREGFVPDFDGTVVSKLKAAGAIILGKLNLTEGAMTGYHRDFKIPRNPWNLKVWSGASSSGSGVATAAGLAFGTLGSDTGGSIRFPSAACGTVGLKPTYGRVSRFGVLDLAQSMDHVGPMTRTVADAAIMLDTISGHDPKDPTSLPYASTKIYPEIKTDISGVKIGIDPIYNSEFVDPEMAAAVSTAIDQLIELGAEPVEVAMPTWEMMAPAIEAWLVILTAEAAAAHHKTFPAQSDLYGGYFRDLLEMGHRQSAVDYAQSHQKRIELNGQIRSLFQTFDLLICPSMPVPAWEIDDEVLYGRMGIRNPSRQKFTTPFDFNGYPTLSIPCGFSKAGLPLSVQLVGHPLQEKRLCQVGHAYQSATNWHRTFPPDLII